MISLSFVRSFSNCDIHISTLLSLVLNHDNIEVPEFLSESTFGMLRSDKLLHARSTRPFTTKLGYFHHAAVEKLYHYSWFGNNCTILQCACIDYDLDLQSDPSVATVMHPCISPQRKF